MARSGKPLGEGAAGLEEGARAGRMSVIVWRETAPARRALKGGGVVLGFGMGGLIDGIVLHQVLQWHHMISSRLPVDSLRALEINTLADGIFNGSMWLVSMGGLSLLWRGMKRDARVPLSTPRLIGWALLGWGAFTVVDSIAFHALLGLHHIREVPGFLAYDVAFFLLGLALIGLGSFLAREEKPVLP